MSKTASKRIFTSESVTEGHPDKLCDQISDAILDFIIEDDKSARVACECITTTGLVSVFGEISTNSYADIPSIVRNTVAEAGYTKPEYGFDYKNCAVITSIDEQSPDIAQGVDRSLESRDNGGEDTGAGDQGMMFGFACDETEELMPAPISYAHKLAYRLAQVRKSAELSWLRPDGKTQVSVLYDSDGSIEKIPAIVVSAQHDPEISISELREAIIDCVIKPIIPAELIGADTKIYINPTGRFVIGGPAGDSGLTGRKIIVDTYGGYACHGGGAFSGKDPTKVDRSGGYMARYIAKNVVAAHLAKQCQIEIAYAIGVAAPVSIFADTRGTGIISDAALSYIISECFDLRPAMIIKKLDLLRPIYRQTATYGHFGRRDIDLPWEQLDMYDELSDRAQKYR